MSRIVHLHWPVAAVLLQFSSAVLAHSHDEGAVDDMGGMKMGDGHLNQTAGEDEWYTTPSYSGLSEHSGILLAHIILMVLAWFFILPIGTSRPLLGHRSLLTCVRHRIQHQQIPLYPSYSTRLPPP